MKKFLGEALIVVTFACVVVLISRSDLLNNSLEEMFLNTAYDDSSYPFPGQGCHHELCDAGPFFNLNPPDPAVARNYYAINHPARQDMLRPESLRQLYVEGQFQELEDYYGSANESYLSGELPEGVYYDIFRREVFDSFSADDRALIDGWAQDFPQSWVAQGLRGIYYTNLGWRARGTAFASSTPDSNFESMNDYFAAALQSLDQALELNPLFQAGHRERINIGRASSAFESADYYFSIAEQYFPYSSDLRHEYMMSLQPRWGGSYPAMRQFALESQAYAGENPRLQILLGEEFEDLARVQQRDNRLEDAEYNYSLALFHGDVGRVLRSRASTYIGMVRNDDYAAANRYLVDNFPDSYPRALLEVGYDLQQAGDSEGARELYLRALDADISYSNTRPIANYLGYFDADLALRAFQEKAANLPYHPAPQFGIAKVLRNQQSPDTADAYQRYIELCNREYCDSDLLEEATQFLTCLEGSDQCALEPDSYEWAL